MKTAYTLLLATLALSACSSSSDRSSGTVSSASALGDRSAQLKSLMQRTAAAFASDHVPQIGGTITVFDDQVQNTHQVEASFSTPTSPNCGDFVPIDGGKCQKQRECTPNEMPPPKPIDIQNMGTLSVLATFDRMLLASPDGYNFEALRSGPLWRGDGDSVTIGFGGGDSGVPAFERALVAPPGDVLATFSRDVDRAAAFDVTWGTAIAPAQASGEMLLYLVQYDPVLTVVACAVPVAQRSMSVPADLLNGFVVGDGNAYLSANSGNVLDTGTIHEGNIVDLTIVLSGLVDVGAHDPIGVPNVRFH